MKIDRVAIFNKYGGKCAYCGCDITVKTMQVDHYLSQYNFTHHIKNNWHVPVRLSHLTLDDVNHFDNLMPACRSCNLYKSTHHMETFRSEIEAQPQRLRAAHPMIKLSERFGMVQIINKPIVFYFEATMTTTPLTAIRNPDGVMYLKEENPFAYNSDVEYHREIGQFNAHDDFEATNPPIIALFECEEGQSFVEGVDVEKITQWQSVYGSWGEIESNWNSNDYEINNFKTRQAFQLIEQKERGKEPADFQGRVLHWLLICFGKEISKDVLERNDRFLEESLELVQSLGYTSDRAHALVDYVFNRPKGEPYQECGGVMVTLAALCSATGLDMQQDGEIEYARISKPEIIEKIRKKQANKPTGSALPQ